MTARRLRTQALRHRAREQSGRLDLARARGHRLDHFEADAHRLGDRRGVERIARFVETFGELAGDAALGGTENISSICSST